MIRKRSRSRILWRESFSEDLKSLKINVSFARIENNEIKRFIEVMAACWDYGLMA